MKQPAESVDLRTNAPTLDVEAFEWEEIGETEELHDGGLVLAAEYRAASRLLTHLNIGGTLHHIEAIAVHDEDGIQFADDPAWESRLNQLTEVFEPDNRGWRTVTINGREYVLVMEPFSR